MPPPLLIDLQKVDLSRTCLTQEQIYELLPQRHEFMLLEGVCHVDYESKQIVAYRDVRPQDWWFRGHVPGRPLLPGVLMLEMAAQLSVVFVKLTSTAGGFVGFGGIDQCKFRGAVVPPCRLYVLSMAREIRTRKISSDTQCVVDGKLVFEARITGMTMH